MSGDEIRERALEKGEPREGALPDRSPTPTMLDLGVGLDHTAAAILDAAVDLAGAVEGDTSPVIASRAALERLRPALAALLSATLELERIAEMSPMKIDRLLFSGTVIPPRQQPPSRLEWWATLVGVSAAGAIAVIGLVW